MASPAHWSPETGNATRTFVPAHTGVSGPAAILARTQVSLAETKRAYETAQSRLSAREAAMAQCQSDLQHQLHEMQSRARQQASDTQQQLDTLLQDQAAGQVELEQLRLRYDLQGAEKRAQVRELREALAAEAAQRGHAQRQCAALARQVQDLANGGGGGDGGEAQRELQARVAAEQQARAQERDAHAAEAVALSSALEEARCEAALERQLRKRHHGHAALLALERSRLLEALAHERETCARLRHQLQLAATLRPAAPRAAAARAASAALPERARSPPHSVASAATTTAAVTERQLLKSLKRASRRAASCHLRELCTDADTLLREGGDTGRSEAALPELQASLRASLAAAQAAAGADELAAARHALEEAFAACRTTGAAAAPDARGAAAQRLSPASAAVAAACEGALGGRKHSARYSADVVSPTARPPAPKTPHETRGVLRRGGDTLEATRAAVAAVAFDALSPLAPAAPPPVTPHPSAGVLMHAAGSGGEGAGSSGDEGAPVVERALPHIAVPPSTSPGGASRASPESRAVSFPTPYAGGPEHRTMRSVDRSPGCTPVVALGGSPGGRVRVQSRPGHDNFAPMKSAAASPGGTPHAHGQGRPPSVRVLSIDIPGHATFNPLRHAGASPGRTPVRSSPGSPRRGGGGGGGAGGAGGAEDAIPARHAPRVSVVSEDGHDDFQPLAAADASPGRTPVPGRGAALGSPAAAAAAAAAAAPGDLTAAQMLTAAAACFNGGRDVDGGDSVRSAEYGAGAGASIAAAARLALTGSGDIRARLVPCRDGPSSHAPPPPDAPRTPRSSAAAARQLRESLSLAGSAPAAGRAATLSTPATSAQADTCSGASPPPRGPTGGSTFVLSPERCSRPQSMTELSVGGACGRRGRAAAAGRGADASSEASSVRDASSPSAMSPRGSSGQLHTQPAFTPP